MPLPSNVEKSAFLKATYVAYDGRGHVWHVTKVGKGWVGRPAANNPARHDGALMRGATLTSVAASLEARRPAAVVEPF